VLQNNLSGKTRILVTHALHFLPQVDYVYVISDGRIAEQGTYAELMARGGEFSVFINEFGSAEEQERKADRDDSDEVVIDSSGVAAEGGKIHSAAGLTEKKEKLDMTKNATAGAALMQTEEMNTGAIEWAVYKTYIKAGFGEVVVPLWVLALVLMQGVNILSSYWYAVLVFSPFFLDLSRSICLGWFGGRNCTFFGYLSM
jgi:ABC-type Fe3+/spermidine/putrescine transport system ATPase subunit